MANTRSAKKRIRSSARKRAYNRPFKAASRTLVKEARASIADQEPNSKEAVDRAVQMLDKAAQKGVIHPNNAARRKSRLMKALNQSQKAAEPEA